MPPQTDAVVHELARVATARHDALEARVRELEIAGAEQRGAATGWTRAQPWISTLVALGALVLSAMR